MTRLLLSRDDGSKAPIDWQRVAQEIESAGKRDRREVRHRVHVIMVNLIKLQCGSYALPRAGWHRKVRTQRWRLITVLDDNCDIRREIARYIRDEIAGARANAQTDLEDHGDAGAVNPAAAFTVLEVLGQEPA